MDKDYKIINKKLASNCYFYSILRSFIEVACLRR